VICKNVGILLTSWRKLQLTVASTLIHMHRMLPNWQYITNILQGWRQSCRAELDRNQCICLSGPHLVASQPWPLNQNVINSHLTPSAPKLKIWLNSLKQLTSFCVHKLLGSTDESMDKKHGTKACNVSCMWHTGEGIKTSRTLWHTSNKSIFYRASYASTVLAVIVCLSVHPSVCLSVCHNSELYKNG